LLPSSYRSCSFALSLVGEPMKKEVTPERWILSPAFGLQVASSGWPPN